MTITILKAVLVIVILAVMILVLLSINHLFSGNFDARESDAERLREDVTESDDVITGQNVFHELVNVREHRTARKEV